MRDLPAFDDENLLVGAEDFSDAGVYRLRDDLCIVQSVDFFPPLVDDPYLYGQIAAANSLSDIFAMGARPLTALNIVGFPDDRLDLAILNSILKGGAERVIAAGAVIVGGHSVRDVEIKYGLSVTGIVAPERLLTNQSAQPGDALVLTKALGTGFVTTAYKAGRCPEDLLAAATASMRELNKAGSEAAQDCGAHASTDITGFGFAGHACEMAQASKVTLNIDLQSLPLLPGVAELAAKGNRTRANDTNRAFCESMIRFERGAGTFLADAVFDPQTSGGLLISVPKDRAGELVERAQASGAAAAGIVGAVVERQDVAVVFR